jgi:hypothetical protein
MFIKNNLNWFSQTNFYVYVNIAPDYIHISVISPLFLLVLFVWYKWLDTKFPAKTGRVIAKKVIVDSAVLGMPLYSAFYLGKFLKF